MLCSLRATVGRSCLALLLLNACGPESARAQSEASGPSPNEASPASDAPTPGIVPEPSVIARAIDFGTRAMGDGSRNGEGFFVETSNMPTGAGWISVGPGYRRWLRDDRVMLEASAALSWRAYKMARGRIELPRLFRSRLSTGAQVRWQDLTQVTYFGDGPASPTSDRSEYRLRSTDVVGYAFAHPVQWLSLGGRVGRLSNVTLMRPAGFFERGYPAAQDLFASTAAFAVADQPAYLYGGVNIEADTRDQRGHPTRGGLYRAAWSRYAARDTPAFSVDRTDAEAAQFIPLAGRRLVVALHGWLALSDPATGGTVPPYLAPSLGGHNTVRAYPDYCFHDRHLLLLSAESRLALFTHVDVAVFMDAGSVAPRASALTLDRRTVGAGVRLHSARTTLARLDVAHGSEGWSLMLRIDDPLHLSRRSDRTAAIPFVP